MPRFTKIVFVSSVLTCSVALADEPPKPSQQILERAKATAGTWKCEGTSPGMDGKEGKLAGTYSSKLDLDGFWIHTSFNGGMVGGKTNLKFKFESYATFDPGLEKWREVFVDNFGGQMVGTAAAMKDGTLDTTSDSQDLMGKGTMTDHLDLGDPTKGAHLWGEGSHDGGKTWAKLYDMTCKK